MEVEVADEVEALLLSPPCWFRGPLQIVHEDFGNENLGCCSTCFCNFKNLSLTQFGIFM